MRLPGRRQVRVLSLVGMLATLSILIGSRVLSTTQSSSTKVPPAMIRTPHKQAKTAVSTAKSRTATHKIGKATTALTAPPKPVFHRTTTLPPSGLPTSLPAALAPHDLAV